MIKNERQCSTTKAQAAKLEAALARLTDESHDSGDQPVHPRLRKAQEEALKSQLVDLREELAEYQALRDGKRCVLALTSFSELPRALVKARIAAGITQRQLAKRLGLKEQQVQRYEATDYASASLARVAAVVEALGLEVREEILLPADAQPSETAVDAPA